MTKTTNRHKLLSEGMRVVHERGFAGASVRDIVQAAGVPQGSFTNHFGSKEAFGLEILDLYFAEAQSLMRQTLLDDSQAPMARLRAYVAGSKAALAQCGPRQGCLLGNLTAEAGCETETMRARLKEIFGSVQDAFAYCLAAAVRAGEVAAGTDCGALAGFILSSLQGAILLAKAEDSLVAFERFESVLFTLILPNKATLSAV